MRSSRAANKSAKDDLHLPGGVANQLLVFLPGPGMQIVVANIRREQAEAFMQGLVSTKAPGGPFEVGRGRDQGG